MAAEELSVSFKNSYKEISFQAPWGVIAAKAWGPEDGKPFLGLHGWLDNANTFDKLVHLLPENIRFVAIDFPGHGQSSHRWPGNMPYLHFECVADTKKVVSQLGWKKFSIIGHSMGASVATLYAGSFPNEVENIILIDYGGPPLQNQYKPAKVLARYATRMSEMKPRTPRAYESVEAAAARREEPYAGIALRKEDALLLTERGTRVIKDGVIFSHDQGLKAAICPFVVPQSSLKLILSKIQCAVLVLEGTDSVRFSNEDRLARLSVTCQHAKFHVWKSVQGGHHFHLDNPEQTAQEIKQFLVLCHDLCSSKL